MNEVNKRINNNAGKLNNYRNNYHQGHCDESHLMDDSLTKHKQTEHTVIDIDDNSSIETQHLLAHDSLAQTVNDQPYIISGGDTSNGNNDNGLNIDYDFNSRCAGSELNLIKTRLPRASANYTSRAELEISFSESSRSVHSFEKYDTYPLIDNSTKNNDDMPPLQLNSSYSSVKSCIVEQKTDIRSVPLIMPSTKFMTTSSFPTILSQVSFIKKLPYFI